MLEYIFRKSCDSSVGITSRLRAGRSGFYGSIPGGGWEFFYTAVPKTALGRNKPPIQQVSGALSLGVKWPRREAYNSPQSSAKVKNAWKYTSTFPIRLHDMVLS
jgi:hypothetical protein